MAKFDVYRNDGALGYLLDCQADLLARLNTRLVIPLLPVDHAPIPAGRLNPLFHIEGSEYVMVTQFAASIPVNALGNKVASLVVQETAIGNAIDMLLSGY